LLTVLVQTSLSSETIVIADSAENAARVIHDLAVRVAELLDLNASVIERAVLERERARTTAFANGAAVPHCRLSGLRQFGIGMMILRNPVRWDNEGHAVDSVMMIVGPTENVSDHLRILANSSQLLDSSALRQKLRSAPDGAAAHLLMSAAEEAVELRRSESGMLRELRKDDANGDIDHLAEVASRFDW
jgi:PTS system nitrogen regulatory IIA component